MEEIFENHKHLMRNEKDNCHLNPDIHQRFEQALFQLAVREIPPSVSLTPAQVFDECFEDMEIDVSNESNVIVDEPQQPRICNAADFRDAVRNLNKDQLRVYRKIHDHMINESADQLFLGVIGSGGTGKSFLINVIATAIISKYGCIALVLGAPTGVSARNIGGNTLHRIFALGVELKGVPKYMKLGGEKLQHMRRRHSQLKYIIIDEISMISYELFRQVDLRLKEIFDNDKPFGGISVILLGDLMQLRPVNGNWIFQQPKVYSAEPHLWRLFNIVELKTNMRQSEIDPLLGICNRLRIGELTEEDVELLRQKIITSENDHIFKDAVRIFPTKEQVSEYNHSRIEEMKAQGIEFFEIWAVDIYASGRHTGMSAPASCSSVKTNRCGGFERSLTLSVGTKVMLLRNLNVSHGLVNGSIGVVRGFTWNRLKRKPDKVGELPTSVEVYFDDDKIKKFHKDGVFSIKPQTVTYTGNNMVEITRQMLPLAVCYAVTVHKIQGETLSSAVIDLGPKLFQNGQAYVALSRVKRFDGLGITNIFPKRLLSSFYKRTGDMNVRKVDQKAYEELCRIQNREFPKNIVIPYFLLL